MKIGGPKLQLSLFNNKEKSIPKLRDKVRKMIFEQQLFDNFCDNFLSHTHIMFLLSLSNVLVFVSIHLFICKPMVVPKIVDKMIVQITQLIK